MVVDQRAPVGRGERDRHCVCREVAPGEVLVDAGGLDPGQGGRRSVRLTAGGGDVDHAFAYPHFRCRELRLPGHFTPCGISQGRGEARPVADDGDVQVGMWASEDEIAHRPADKVRLARNRIGGRGELAGLPEQCDGIAGQSALKK